MLKRLAGAAVVSGVAIFGGAQAMDDNTTRDANGEITEAGGLGVLKIQPGDCLQLPDAVEVQSVEAVPCAEPHDAQAYASTSLAGFSGPYDEDGVWEAGGRACVSLFDGFVGRSYEQSDLGVDLFYPTAEGWESGDRTVTCMLLPPEGQQTMVGDMENADR